MEQVCSERWFFIWIPFEFSFCIGAKDGLIFWAADCVAWMRGKTLEEIKLWLKEKKNKTVIELKKDNKHEHPFPNK
jgi:hypothetical protein